MQKLVSGIILVFIAVVGFMVYYFYQNTSGFTKAYKSLEVTLNGEVIEDTSSNNALVIGNSYVFKMNDKLTETIDYTCELVPYNDFKYKIDSNYYSWLNVHDKETSSTNLDRYFSLNKQNNKFTIKPIMTIQDIVADYTGKKKSDIEFSTFKDNVDYIVLNMTINESVYTYSFRVVSP
ncbi:MAG: hypothetical protein NC310_02005 [Roseburia sp.]|nr:hypothetical protein [Roseburia sp.]MCM1556299.1 hypothetical protein [Anaeroplasma bactoclasticum]